LAERRGFDDGAVALGVVDVRPGVGVYDCTAEDDEEPGCVRYVDDDDDYADDEEADKAGFCGIARADEAGEFAAVAVEAVGQDAYVSSQSEEALE
jgi:hypothetical protein